MNTNINLKGRSLLSLNDLSDAEMLYLLDLAAKLKRRKKEGTHGDLLVGRNIAMIFEKLSTRTRCSVSVAAADEGGMAEYLSTQEIHLGKKESVIDTARVLGRMFDGILIRCNKHKTVQAFAKFAGVPIWNGLSDEEHPLQALADLMTVQEKFGKLKGLKAVYLGDGRNNVATSLMVACAKAGMDFVDCTPKELLPSKSALAVAEEAARRNGSTVKVMQSPQEAVAGANVVCTDVWASMGEEAKFAERLALLKPYQVNMDLMKATGNLEKNNVIFMHCLPALHDDNTEVTRSTGALEVTNDVFEAPFSRVFDEAENRVHTTKAVFVATIVGGGIKL